MTELEIEELKSRVRGLSEEEIEIILNEIPLGIICSNLSKSIKELERRIDNITKLIADFENK